MTADLRTSLALLDPAPGHTYDDAALRRMARRVLDAENPETAPATVEDFVVAPAAPTRHARPRRRLAVALAVAAVLVTGAVVVPALIGTGSREHGTAVALLAQAADAITATDPPARGDQYWQLASTGFVLAQSVAGDGQVTASLVSQIRTSYVAVDGSRPTIVVAQPDEVLRQLSGPPASDGSSLRGPRGFGVSSLPAPDDAPPSWQSPTTEFLAVLPRDPGELLARVRADTAGQGRSADGEVVVTVADVLRTGLVPADLRAALYRALAQVPGVVVSDVDATVDGRSGVAFAFQEPADGTRQELVVDPTTGDLVGEREVATVALTGIPAGTVIGESSTTRTLVDRVPAEVEAGGIVFHCTTAADGGVTCTG